MRGRKPKPTRVKELEGNPGKRRLNTTESHPPVPAAVPYAPKFVNAEAKAEWNRMVNILLGMGLYTEVDHAALAMYCQAWGRWVIAERKLSAEGEIITTCRADDLRTRGGTRPTKRMHRCGRCCPSLVSRPVRDRGSVLLAAPDQPSLAEQLFSMVGGDVKVGEMAIDFTAERYVDDVLSGRQVACKWVRLACERHRRDLENGNRARAAIRRDDGQDGDRVFQAAETLEGRVGRQAVGVGAVGAIHGVVAVRVEARGWDAAIPHELPGGGHGRTARRRWRRASDCT